VEVVASQAGLQTTDSTVGNVLAGKSLLLLPTFTRQANELLTVQPGVSPLGSVTGARRDQNAFTLDGIDSATIGGIPARSDTLAWRPSRSFESALPTPTQASRAARAARSLSSHAAAPTNCTALHSGLVSPERQSQRQLLDQQPERYPQSGAERQPLWLSGRWACQARAHLLLPQLRWQALSPKHRILAPGAQRLAETGHFAVPRRGGDYQFLSAGNLHSLWSQRNRPV
jgi:hypothetical protein